jgi:hypothetical protein
MTGWANVVRTIYVNPMWDASLRLADLSEVTALRASGKRRGVDIAATPLLMSVSVKLLA